MPASLQAFHEAMVAVVPTVNSVSIPDENDRSTWVVQFEKPPTKAELKKIAKAIEEYDIDTPHPAEAARRQLVSDVEKWASTSGDDLLASILRRLLPPEPPPPPQPPPEPA